MGQAALASDRSRAVTAFAARRLRNSGAELTRRKSFSASSAPTGASPFSQRERRGCGIPVLREISDWDRPASVRRLIRSVVSLISHTLCDSAWNCNALSNYPKAHSAIMDGRTLLRGLLDEADLNPNSLAKTLGDQSLQSKLSRYLSGVAAEPRRSTLEPVANFFKVPTDAFYNSEEAARVARSRGLARFDDEAGGAKGGVEGLTRGVVGIPVVGTAQLGDDGHFYELEYPVGHGDGTIDWPSKDKNAYVVRCKGESMKPRIRHGEYVVVEPNHEVAPGDEVLVKAKDGRVMIKQLAYIRDGMVHLDSVNESHPRISILESDVAMIQYVAGIAKSALWSPD